MKRNILFFVPRQAIRCLWACMLPMLAAALLTGCSKMDDPDALPAGKYPINFTAAVDGLTVQKAGTRATGKDAWAADDPISISTHADGSSPKTYKITDASTGAMEPDNTGDVLYWQLSKNQPIRAWHPATDVANADISNQSAGYAAFDYLTSDGTYNFASSVSLSFKHRMAKVKYILQKGEGISDTELNSATVQIYGFTQANFAGGTLTGTTNDWITPYATGKEAIVVPQQMKNQKFIKVTINGSDYYYTPTGDNDANLESGKQYTYAITVNKDKLAVTVTNNGAQWNAGSTTTGGSEATTFKVKIPTVSGVSPTIAGASQTDGEIYTTAGNSFSITLTVGDGMQGFNVKGGICDVKRVVENGSYKSTYFNIRSNLELAYSDVIEVGDYYNNDGAWSKYYNMQTCIGVIFKLGAAGGDVASNYGDKLADGVIRGYVVALTDALDYAGEWGARGIDENNDYLPNISASSDAQYNGYTQTKYVLETYAGGLSRYEAFSAVQSYSVSVSAPTRTSGWYLPSQKQLADVWRHYKGAAGNVLYDRLNVVGTSSLFQTGQGGKHNKNNAYRYWSSTEKNSTDAWYVTFDTGGVIDAYAKDNGYDRLCRARAILTF